MDIRFRLTLARSIDIHYRMLKVKLLLALPDAIAAKLSKDAAKKRKTRQAVILELLAKNYGLKVQPPKPGRPINKK